MSWKDVTAECEWDGFATLFHKGGGPCGDEVVTGNPAYRLTKISGPLTPHVAFIVEKRT